MLGFSITTIIADEEERENRAQNPYFVIGAPGPLQTYHFGYDTKVCIRFAYILVPQLIKGQLKCKSFLFLMGEKNIKIFMNKRSDK